MANTQMTSEIEVELRQLTRKFFEEKIQPHIEADEAVCRFRPEWIKEMGALGLCGITTPEEFGGSGLGFTEYTAVVEEMSRVHASYAISVSVTGLAQTIIAQYGNEKQKKRILPKLASGEAIGAFSLSEPSSGSDAGSLRTTAVKKGDHYLVNGTKLWTTQADSADFILLMARTGEPGAKGISTFILEKGMKGFTCGKMEKKMGLHCSHTMEVILENVEIPVENLIGNEGDGFKIAMTALDAGRINIGATANGITQGALEVAVKHSKEREQFGKPLHQFQGVSFMLADIATGLKASQLLVRQSALLKDAGLPFSTEAAMAKVFCTDHAMKSTTDAVQILGGSGYTTDFAVERFMRESKVLQIVEGANQIQRIVIGRSLL